MTGDAADDVSAWHDAHNLLLLARPVWPVSTVDDPLTTQSSRTFTWSDEGWAGRDRWARCRAGDFRVGQ
jgi:hypothetical protein